MSKILLPFFLLFSFTTGWACSLKKSPQLESLARDFMKKNKLILAEDEQSFPELGVQVKWELIRLETASLGNCLAVMSLCTKVNGARECTTAHDVLGLVPTPSPKIVPFANVVSLPKSAIARIGLEGGLRHPDLGKVTDFYALLKGASMVDAYKSLVAKVPYFGFSGVAVLGKKASFDPTPKRNWQLEKADYSLRRGTTAEVLDIQAFQFDGMNGDANAYWTGCNQPNNKFGKCDVAPWGQSFILELKAQN